MPRLTFTSVRICAREGCSVRTTNAKYCSQKCCKMANRKAQRPSREELAKMVWEYPATELGKYYGVSDRAILKWCEQYQIDRPPRGYWTGKTRKTCQDLKD